MAESKKHKGATLEALAAAKKLPLDFLKDQGLKSASYNGADAIEMTFQRPLGDDTCTRYRVALGGDDHTRTKKDDKTFLITSEEVFTRAEETGRVWLVEGETDLLTLTYHDEAVVAAMGGGNVNAERDAPFLEKLKETNADLIAVQEPDKTGAGFVTKLAEIIGDELKVTTCAPEKDPSAVHIAVDGDFAAFSARLDSMHASARTPAEIEQERLLKEARDKAGMLPDCDDVLSALRGAVRPTFAGDTSNLELVYLTMTTRLFDTISSVAVKGPSAGGKSYIVDIVLKLMPVSAYVQMTSMSDKALIYLDDDLGHRMLVLAEAAGTEQQEMQDYLIRTLLSEGRIVHHTVERQGGEHVGRKIEKEGPTGMIVTTTKTRLHPENETRLISVDVVDTEDQTRAVMRNIADRFGGNVVEYSCECDQWQAYQEWLAAGETRVVIPWARTLSEAIPPMAVRLRRDFSQILNLVKAHALLHRNSRAVDQHGRIVATIGEDYREVHRLLADRLAEAAGGGISDTVRETVETVQALTAKADTATVNAKQVGDALHLDRSAAQRRLDKAIRDGLIENEETRPRRPGRYRCVAGSEMTETPVLPSPEALELLIDSAEFDRTSPESPARLHAYG